MKTQFKLMAAALFFVAGFVVASEKNQAVLILAGSTTAESTAPELSEIVDLCAAEEEEKFAKRWSKYVAHNDLKGDQLHKTIAWVSDEAALQRTKSKHLSGEESNDEAWKAERQKLMSEIARRALNPLR